MKKALSISLIIICILVMQGFVRSIVTIWQKQSLIDQAKQELAKEQKKHQLLRQQAALIKQTQYIEEEARNKLLMVKAGEAQVVIPQTLLPKEQKQQETPQDTRPYWQQWVRMFF